MYLKKWGGVGWWWVSSRSGWLLELLTELIKSAKSPTPNLNKIGKWMKAGKVKVN